MCLWPGNAGLRQLLLDGNCGHFYLCFSNDLNFLPGTSAAFPDKYAVQHTAKYVLCKE